MTSEKGKINPFAGVLQPDEALVWAYTPQPMPFLQHFIRYLVMCVAGVIIIGFAMAVLFVLLDATDTRHPYNPTGLPWYMLLLTFTATNSLVITPCAGPLLLLMYPLGWLSNQRAGKSTYGITTRRLLTATQSRVTGIALKDLRHITSRRGTLSFGRQFPAWTHLEDAEAVKIRIEQARDDQA